MTQTTANREYPYPEGTDPPSGHTQMQALAEAVDADVAGLPIVQMKKSIIAAEQFRNSGGWGYLGTNDKVTGIVLPTDGVICVLFHALAKSSVAWDDGGEARAAIFLNDTNQLTIGGSHGAGPPPTQFAPISTSAVTADNYAPLVSSAVGLRAAANDDDEQTVTTGQIIGATNVLRHGTNASDIVESVAGDYNAHGGPCYIFAAAGTYEVGVKFDRSNGSVYAKERKLWVWTMAAT